MASHDERVRSIQTAFSEANGQLIGQLEKLSDATATKNAAEGWNPAQIGWHVAATNEFLSGALSGAMPDMDVPKPAGFAEALSSMKMPDKVKTFPALEPPATVSKADAVTKLRASADAFSKALTKATPERCSSRCVKLPFAVVSLYEVGEFTSGHIQRHIGQVNRTVAS